MSEPKLIIPMIDDADTYGTTIRLTNKADALLDAIAQKSGRTKRFIASKMIEFAFDFVEVAGFDSAEPDE